MGATGPVKSYIVSFYGIDGQREHFMPGNRRRGTGVRAKRPFETERDALAFLEQHPWMHRGTAYLCGICGKWHTASPKRR